MKTLFFLMIWTGLALGQNLTALEKNYHSLLEQKTSIENQRAAAQAELDRLAGRLDREKQQGKSDDELAAQMARAFEITRQVSGLNRRLDEINTRLADAGQLLYAACTAKLDSLMNEMDSPGLTAGSRRGLEEAIFSIAEKRMAVSPLAARFSFDPGKISRIDLSASGQDSVSLAIYRDYLRSALQEIDQQIAALHTKETEIERMQRLERRADEFLSDMADSRIVGLSESQSGSPSIRANAVDEASGEFFLENKMDYQNQLEGFYSLLNQLQTLPLPVPSKALSDLQAGSGSQSYEELLNKIRVTQKYLELYRQIVLRKMQ